MYKVTVNGKDFYGCYDDMVAIREMAIRKNYRCSRVQPAR